MRNHTILYRGVHIKNDALTVVFAKQLLEMRNDKLATDESIQCITLPNNFCKITVTTNELIEKVIFPNLPQNYSNHQWLNA